MKIREGSLEKHHGIVKRAELKMERFEFLLWILPVIKSEDVTKSNEPSKSQFLPL